MDKKVDLSHLADRWSSSVVSRDRIADFSGGVLSPGRMANLDACGQGPDRIRIGRKVAYPVNSLISWLEDRTENVQRKK